MGSVVKDASCDFFLLRKLTLALCSLPNLQMLINHVDLDTLYAVHPLKSNPVLHLIKL